MRIDKSRVLDCNTWRPPTRRLRVKVKTPDGREYTEDRVERLKGVASVPALCPAGYERRLTVGNAHALAEGYRVPYHDQILWRKHQKGWLRMDVCPITEILSGRLTWNILRDETLRGLPPCSDPQVCAAEPCPHLRAEQEHRQAMHHKKERDRAAQYQAEADRQKEAELKLRSDLVETNRESTEALRAVLAELVAKKK